MTQHSSVQDIIDVYDEYYDGNFLANISLEMIQTAFENTRDARFKFMMENYKNIHTFMECVQQISKDYTL